MMAILGLGLKQGDVSTMELGMDKILVAKVSIGKILLTSPIVINVQTRASLAVETKDLLFLWLAYLNNKSNVCKQISSPLQAYQ